MPTAPQERSVLPKPCKVRMTAPKAKHRLARRQSQRDALVLTWGQYGLTQRLNDMVAIVAGTNPLLQVMRETVDVRDSVAAAPTRQY